MLGAKKNINEILACCDVFILPSISEGLPLVLVEAQAAGLPCVVSTGVSEDANCGKMMRLPLAEGAKKFAQTISDILDGKIQLEIDEEKLWQFDCSYTVKQLEAVYEG